MKITEIEAIALVWPPPEKQYWTALRPIGRVSELIVRVHTDTGLVGIGEAHGAGMPFPGIYKQDGSGNIQPEGAPGWWPRSSSPLCWARTLWITRGCGTRCLR